jgi:hypothetical protein
MNGQNKLDCSIPQLENIYNDKQSNVLDQFQS